MIRRFFILFLMVCIGGPGLLWAQNDNAGSSSDHVELAEISVVGRQLEEKLSTELAEYGHKVVVIDSEALTKSGYVTVSQALANMVPGFYLRSSARSSRTMRLNGSSNFLMLLDGVRLNNRMFGSTASPDAIGIHMVDHIEVLFGGEGLFYGTDATAGVINIVTKKPT